MSTLRVFIVDDSTVFRSQIRQALQGQDGVEVVGFATDGRMACEALKHKEVDVITLDLEMPVMNGLETLAQLKLQGCKAHVLVLSSHTRSGAEATLSALQSGASDFLLKPQLNPEATITPAEAIRAVLLPKVQQFHARSPAVDIKPPSTTMQKRFAATNWGTFIPKVLVVASSTGGPAALDRLFGLIRAPLSCPILIVQHMPPIFTAALATRLGRISGLAVAEAQHQMPIEKGKVYVAPGDFHMRVALQGTSPLIHLDKTEARNSVRPAADNLFESASSAYKNAVLGMVLTGMGADGKDGAVAIKLAGGAVMIQDKESCAVFGMPGAVHQEQAYDHMGTTEALAQKLNELSICALERAA